jgi:bacillithiol biosynthesis cysteine-adding enzyme BshC
VQESSASTATRWGIDLRQFPLIRRLAVDYVYNFAALSDCYAGDPQSPDAWRAAIARAQRHDRQRDALSSILGTQLDRRGAPERARAGARAIADPRCVVVVTGQQAGLFGGPLFTLLKALTTIQLAERTSRQHGVPAIPVFWIDAEDHDWAEVASITVLDADLAPRRVTLPPVPGAGELPVAQVRIDDAIATALDELATALPSTEFTDRLLTDLRETYRPGAGMADAFGRWLERCLGHFGLVVFDSSDPAAKPLAAQVFRHELEHPGKTAALAAEAGAALAARGYHAQVTINPDAVSLFWLDQGRQPIRRADGRFLVGERQEDARTLIDLAEHSPERFSPNVLLRPVVQDTLFPTACYVSGPSELAYLGQLRGVYEHCGVPMPLMYPRGMATLLDAGAARFLSRYDVPFEALQPQDEAWLNRLLQAQLPSHVEASLNDARRAIQERMAAVIAAVPAIDPTLEGAARSTHGKMEHDLRTLHGKVIQAAKRRDDTLRRQFIRARAQAFPGGHLQERELGFVFFLNRYGPAIVDLLASELPPDPGRHWILTP